MAGPHRGRFPLMALAMLALLAGLWGGLDRLDWPLPPLQPGLAYFHGPLMISGFLGTLIGLERAVALGRLWTYAAPLSSGLGALALIGGLRGWTAPLLMSLGSLGLLAMSVVILLRQPAFFTAAMGLGALSWLAANLLWLAGWPFYRVVFLWAGFLVLTIAGERLELARLLRLSGTIRAAFLGALGLFLGGLVLAGITFETGVRVAGGGLIALALWLARYDVARRTVRQRGLPRFIALCLLSGYAWLGVSGLLGVLFGGLPTGPHYDAMLHALFLGFVFAMIFGHAPIIFPAVLGLPVPFRPVFYVHLLLLHLTLILRMVGDLGGWLAGIEWGGLLNSLTLLLFLGSTVFGIRTASPVAPPRDEMRP